MRSPTEPVQSRDKKTGIQKIVKLSERLDQQNAEEVVDAITAELANVTLDNITALKNNRDDIKNGAAAVAAIRILDEYSKEFKPRIGQRVAVKFA